MNLHGLKDNAPRLKFKVQGLKFGQPLNAIP